MVTPLSSPHLRPSHWDWKSHLTSPAQLLAVLFIHQSGDGEQFLHIKTGDAS